MLLTRGKGSGLRRTWGDEEGLRDLLGERQSPGAQWVREGWDRVEPELVSAQPRGSCVYVAPLTAHHRSMSVWGHSDPFLQQMIR